MARAVLTAFDELLTRLALTDNQRQVASTRQNRLRDFLRQRFELVDDPWLTGSYSRQTIVRQDRDIDVMASFSVSRYWSSYEHNSVGFVQLVRDALNREYGSSDVSRSGAAVVMRMEVFNVDVVPVFARQGDGFLLSNGVSRWKATNPPFHFKLMEDHNTRDPRLKPLVKLMKFWNICNDALLESFHLEMMIERMWQSGTIDSYPDGVKETLRVLPVWLRESFSDPWADGGLIDGYLTPQARAKAIQFAEADAAASARAETLRRQGDDEAAFDSWQTIFRFEFPAYG